MVQNDDCHDEENVVVNENEIAEAIVRKKQKVIRIKFTKINEDFWEDIFKIGHDLMIKRNLDVVRFRGVKRRKSFFIQKRVASFSYNYFKD